MLPDETNFDVSRRNLLRYRHDNCKTSRAQQNRNMTAVRRFMTLVAAALLAGTMTALAQDVPAVQEPCVEALYPDRPHHPRQEYRFAAKDSYRNII